MPAVHTKQYFLRTFHSLWTILILSSLVLSGLPLSAVQAAGTVVTKEGIATNPLKAPLAAPGVDVALGIHPLERVMIGEDFEFYLTFDNSSAVGYGPFIDLIFPSNGADGAAGTATPDGINFVSAEYESYTLPATTLTFPDADGPSGPGTTGCVSHPFALDSSGVPAQVCGTAGDTLVVLDLPFSSITSEMPELWTKVTTHVSNLADVDVPLQILGRGGYRFGADSLNNPATDPAILNPSSSDGTGWPSLQVTPRVIHIEKDYDGPKECPYLAPDEPVLDETECPYGNVNPVYESVSGPNFPRHYDINIYVAAGQTVTNLDVTDYFPNNLAYLSVTSLGGGTLVDAPTVGAAANPPDNDLIVNFASLTGSTDIVVEFFIPELDADGNPVLDPVTGAPAVAENTASAVGDWTPVDTRDPGGPDNVLANPGHDILHTLDIRSIAVQKSVAIIGDTGTIGDYNPGDILEYTLNFQISDYFSFDSLVLTDSLTDGQHVFSDFTPTLQIDGNGYTLPTAAFGAANYDISCNYTGGPGPECTANDPAADDGATKLTFRVSPEIIARGQNGRMLGGCVNPAGGMLPVCTPASPGDDPTTGVITFRAVVQEDFSNDYPSGDASVDHGDALYNSVDINGNILDNSIFASLGPATPNDSAQKIEIVYGDIAKSVYAVNGSTSFTAPAEVQPGDTITFRMTQTLPSSDSDKLLLTDYLPLPIFDATEVTANPFDNLAPNTTIPAAGHANYGPANTLNAALLATPVIPISADATNSLSFDFGSFDDPSDTASVLDILFTVTVTNAPYADGSVLTNLGVGFEDTTNSYQHIYIGNDQFILKEPGISLRKGVVASDNAAAVFVPNPPGPVPFNAPGSNPSWTGVIVSGDKDPNTALINSDVENVLGGDLLTFAIVLENLGSSSLGAFDVSVKDTLPANMKIPTGGINLQARRGDGAAVTFTPVGSTATEPSGLFDGGIIFTDESPTQGVAHVYDPANGQNLIVVTYDLQIAAGLAGGTAIVNTATLLSYAGTEGGPNHVGATPTTNVNSDNATTTTTIVSQLLKNGGFDQASKSMLPRYWSPNYFVKGSDTLVRSTFQGGKYALKLTGNGRTKAIMQTISLTGAAGDKFTLSLWSKSQRVPKSGTYAVQVQFMDGKILAGKVTAKFTNGTHTWKQVTKTFTAPADYTSIRFIIIFGKTGGAAWFDGASLVTLP